MKQYNKGYLDSFKESIRFLNKRLIKYKEKEKKQITEKGCVDLTLLAKKTELLQIRKVFLANYQKMENKLKGS